MPSKKPPKKAALSKEERSERMVEKKEAKKHESVTPPAPVGTLIKVTFHNATSGEALLYLVDSSGIERFMARLDVGKSSEQSCKSPANWTVKVGGKDLKAIANRDLARFEIGEAGIKTS